jgi:hypothetical protein
LAIADCRSTIDDWRLAIDELTIDNSIGNRQSVDRQSPNRQLSIANRQSPTGNRATR